MNKKILIPLMILILLLGGCSKKDTNLEDTNISNNLLNESTENIVQEEIVTEVEQTHFETYTDLYNHISDNGIKLEKFLKNNNVEYVKSPNNQVVMSKDTEYEMYEQTYVQKFEYDKYAIYDHYEEGFTPNAYIDFKLKKEYHIEDELKSDDPYYKLFYNSAKNYDETLTEEGLLTLLNEHRISKESITLYEDEDEIIRFYAEDTMYRLTVEIKPRYTLNEINEEISIYETVGEFKDRVYDYDEIPDEYSPIYSDVKLVDSSSNIGYSIGYNQNTSGDLSETYSFTLMYDPLGENKYYKSLPEDVKLSIPKFFDVINEHVGFDIINYMTQEQFIEEVEGMMLKNRYNIENTNGIPSSYMNAPLPGNNEIRVAYNSKLDERPYGSIVIREHEEITISIEKKVIAEGKSVL